MTTLDSTVSYTQEHIEHVQNKMNYFADILVKRGEIHDSSKLEEPEVFGWAAMDHEPKYEYGSSAYYEKMNRYKAVFEHHYAVNKHHPEHFKNPETQMSLIDLLEMLCDWFLYKEVFSWWEGYDRICDQCKRFGFSNTIKSLLLNTFKEFLTNTDYNPKQVSEADRIYADITLNYSVTANGWKKQAEKEQEAVEQKRLADSLNSLLDLRNVDFNALRNFTDEVTYGKHK